jgi:hypothetical protein
MQAAVRAATQEIERLTTDGQIDQAVDLGSHLITLAGRIDSDQFVVSKLVARSIEMAALKCLPDDVGIGETGESAAARFDRLKNTKHDIMGAPIDIEQTLPQLDESTIRTYFQRVETFGEAKAIQWLRQRLPGKIE